MSVICRPKQSEVSFPANVINANPTYTETLRLLSVLAEKDDQGEDPVEGAEPPKSGFEGIGREALQGLGEKFKKVKEGLGKVACWCVGASVVGARNARENDPAQLSEELLYLSPGEAERIGELRAKVEARNTAADVERNAAREERAKLREDYDAGKEARQDEREVNRRTLDDLSAQQKSDKKKLSSLKESHDNQTAAELRKNIETTKRAASEIEEAIAGLEVEKRDAEVVCDDLRDEVKRLKAAGRENTLEFIEASEQLADAEYRMGKFGLAIKRDSLHLANMQHEGLIYSNKLSAIEDMEGRRLGSISELRKAAVERKAARQAARRDTWKSHVEGVRAWFKTGLSLAKTTKVGRMFARLKRGR